jgi:hypothetical protein
MTAAMAPTKPLNATDLCDRCGAQAYVRVVLPGSAELLFCAHHNREHAEALAKIAVEIHDETDRLAPSGPNHGPSGSNQGRSQDPAAER